MVGVPALVRCVCGPSSRTAWPILYCVSLRIILGPTTNEIMSAVMRRQHRAQRDVAEDVERPDVRREPVGEREQHQWPPSPQLRSIRRARCDDALHVHEARALDEHGRSAAAARRSARATSASTDRRSARPPAPNAATACVGQRARPSAADRCRRPARTRRFRDETPGPVADLAHVAQHQPFRAPARSASTAIAARTESGLAL